MPFGPGNKRSTCSNQRHEPMSAPPECKQPATETEGIRTRPIVPTLLHPPNDLLYTPVTPVSSISGSPTTLDQQLILSCSNATSVSSEDPFDSANMLLEQLPNDDPPDLSFLPGILPSDQPFDFSLPVDPSWHASLQLPSSSTRFASPPRVHSNAEPACSSPVAVNVTSNKATTTTFGSERYTDGQARAIRTPSISKPYSRPTRPQQPMVHSVIGRMTDGQASLFGALLSLAGSEERNPRSPESTGSVAVLGSSESREAPFLYPRDDETSDEESEEHLEDVEKVLCIAPRMDNNVESNTLAFVLGSYARWFNLTMFDPLRIVEQAKASVIAQFSSSSDDRTRIILVANAFNAFERTTDISSRGVSLVSVLRAGVRQSVAQFSAIEPLTSRERDIEWALVTLKNMLEVIVVHFYCDSLSAILSLMQHTAPVFRRACLEPFDQLPNLPNILSAPELPKRYFAAIDVGLSVLSARPMLFRYDVVYPRGFFDKPLPADYGVEWLHGIPDRFVVIFAWINALGEDYGTHVSPETIAEIEGQIVDAQMTINCKDPSLRLRRMAVQECWRQASLIYLYLKLCGVNVKDPRVIQAHRKFMGIEASITPGRHPDAFMFIPMIVSGVAACKKSDQHKIQKRMLGTRECSISGIVGNGHVRVLQDLWVRMSQQRRVATWEDFRLSNEQVLGV